MKKFLLTLTAIFICTIAYAHTIDIDWLVGNSVYNQSTCEYGGDLIVPTAPIKYGYTFNGWVSFTPIEYLESTGTQYIDTGVKTGINITIESVLKITDNINSLNYSGTVYAANQGWIAFGSYGNGTLVSYFSENQRNGVEIPFDKEFHRYYLRNGLQKIDEIKANNTVSQMPTYLNLYLFMGNVDFGGASFLKKQIIKFCKIWQDDILVRDFIPVLDNDGVPCLYDLVEGKFYYNAGTGQFIAGPVI